MSKVPGRRHLLDSRRAGVISSLDVVLTLGGLLAQVTQYHICEVILLAGLETVLANRLPPRPPTHLSSLVRGLLVELLELHQHEARHTSRSSHLTRLLFILSVRSLYYLGRRGNVSLWPAFILSSRTRGLEDCLPSQASRAVQQLGDLLLLILIGASHDALLEEGVVLVELEVGTWSLIPDLESQILFVRTCLSFLIRALTWRSSWRLEGNILRCPTPFANLSHLGRRSALALSSPSCSRGPPPPRPPSRSRSMPGLTRDIKIRRPWLSARASEPIVQREPGLSNALEMYL